MRIKGLLILVIGIMVTLFYGCAFGPTTVKITQCANPRLGTVLIKHNQILCFIDPKLKNITINATDKKNKLMKYTIDLGNNAELSITNAVKTVFPEVQIINNVPQKVVPSDALIIFTFKNASMDIEKATRKIGDFTSPTVLDTHNCTISVTYQFMDKNLKTLQETNINGGYSILTWKEIHSDKEEIYNGFQIALQDLANQTAKTLSDSETIKEYLKK